MKQQGKVISGSDLSRNWGENKFFEELVNVFPADYKEAGFEFVKNCGGSVVKPNLPHSRMIDSNTI